LALGECMFDDGDDVIPWTREDTSFPVEHVEWWYNHLKLSKKSWVWNWVLIWIRLGKLTLLMEGLRILIETLFTQPGRLWETQHLPSDVLGATPMSLCHTTSLAGKGIPLQCVLKASSLFCLIFVSWACLPVGDLFCFS
jgi:hypothetical protein